MIVDQPTAIVGEFNSKTGVVKLDLKQHRSGMWHRIGVVDLMSIQECFHNYQNVIVSNRIVMDVGANVGGFSFFAASHGASQVYAFEPEPYTFSMLAHNIGNINNVHAYNRALTNKTDDRVNLYVGHGAGAPSYASIEARRGRDCISVKNENFKHFCEKNQPQTIKMDIEGGEYDIVLDIPDSCDELALEWHGSTPERRNKFEKIYPMFLENGWIPVHEKKKESFKKYALSKGKIPRWAIDGHYRR